MRSSIRALVFLLTLLHKAEVLAVTGPLSQLIEGPMNIDQLLPDISLNAGRELELRRVQNLLSGQETKPTPVCEPRS